MFSIPKLAIVLAKVMLDRARQQAIGYVK